MLRACLCRIFTVNQWFDIFEVYLESTLCDPKRIPYNPKDHRRGQPLPLSRVPKRLS